MNLSLVRPAEKLALYLQEAGGQIKSQPLWGSAFIHLFIYFFYSESDLHRGCLSNVQPPGCNSFLRLSYWSPHHWRVKKRATWVSGATDAVEAAACVDTDALVQARWVFALIHIQVTQRPKVPLGANTPEPEEGVTKLDQKEARAGKSQTTTRGNLLKTQNLTAPN